MFYVIVFIYLLFLVNHISQNLVFDLYLLDFTKFSTLI